MAKHFAAVAKRAHEIAYQPFTQVRESKWSTYLVFESVSYVTRSLCACMHLVQAPPRKLELETRSSHFDLTR